ncbi:MAG: helix-turn-helix transcriptional regulator [Ruminococcus sp.]|nr:helix-turn-helix transcriptional regulator [Ruminococcus sp.]
MESKNVNRNQLSRASNTRFDVVNKWYNNQVEKMDLDVLARFCYILDCQPSDIIKYK